ncbi:MAG TPA: hypothetical protein VNI77_08490 [Nitrososphaera sp.]|nr:hypothetical protein [Nitrososphaera sp.]
MKKKLFAGLAVAAIIVLGLAIAVNITGITGASGSNCVDTSLFGEFSRDSFETDQIAYGFPSLYVSEEGTIVYLYDNFANYADNQFIIDGFEDPNAWMVNGEAGKLKLASEYYGGSGALTYDVESNIGNTLELSSSHRDDLLDLSRWQDSGYITMWMKAPEPKGIDSVRIAVKDDSGNTRYYMPLENVHSPNPNTFSNDPDYPDLVYPEGNPAIDMWVDFVLGPGWNFLLWRADQYHDDGNNVDMSRISEIAIILDVNEGLTGQNMIFDDLRIQGGLQKSSNPTGGMWYPPHGRPQHGVYDIDRSQDGINYELRLLNVRNTQYPSNGDRGTMITSAPVPMDFVMRVRFTLIQVGHENKSLVLPSPFPAWTPSEWREIPIYEGLRNNTYFRVTYDFEPSWDPGHDWFGAYLSLEYNRFGLVSVWPVEQNVLQDQEPKAGAKTSSTEFAPLSDVQYEMHLLAKGQFLSASVYEVKRDDCLERKAGMSYTFDHPRYGSDKRYPLAIESTGNMRTIIHEVEIVSLDQEDADGITRIR